MLDSIKSHIGGDWRVIGVLGYPVQHSLSPAMQNAAIQALSLPLVYVPFEVSPEHLATALDGLSALNMVGVNLTIPHKEAAVPLMDALASRADRIGSVNTVVFDGGKKIGYSTDGIGFLTPLHERRFQLKGAQCVIIGAGGAGRAILYALGESGASVSIINRTPTRSERLAAEVNQVWPGIAKHLEWADKTEVEAAFRSCDLLVNATPLGMAPHDKEVEWDLPLRTLPSTAFVYDLVYRPAKTRLMEIAEDCGCETMNGLKMLVHQGAESFRIWTGITPPVAVMERAALEQLRSCEA